MRICRDRPVEREKMEAVLQAQRAKSEHENKQRKKGSRMEREK